MSDPEHGSAPSRGGQGLVARVALLLAAVAAMLFAGAGLRSLDLANEGALDIARASQGSDPAAELDRGHAAFDRARRWRSDPAVHVQEARSLLLSRSSPRRAIAVLERATRREPDYADAWALLQVAHLRAGDEDAAARARAQVVRLDPTSGRGR